MDLYGFSVICHGGATWMAEPVLFDSLLLGLENYWFNEKQDGRLSHHEFREELFKTIWEKSRDKTAPVKIGTDVPLGHDEMAFYQLPQISRAALYLRTKKHFSYSSVSLILGSAEGVIRAEVERAREFLLGRRVREASWSEEDF